MSVFQPISFQALKVGKVFKSSKKRFTWKILLDGLDYTVDMYYSKISTKIKIFVNNEMVLDTKAKESQYYKFKIRYRPLYVIKTGENFDLRYGTISSENVLKTRVLGGNVQQAKRSATPKVPLRRSLPCALPQNILRVSFTREVADFDLLGIGNEPKNPFDNIEDSEEKPHNLSTLGLNTVPWPAYRTFPYSSS